MSSNKKYIVDKMNTFGERLQKAISSCGIKKKTLAEFVGIHENMITRYIQNKNIPNINTVKLIAHYTGIDLIWLITGMESEKHILYKRNQKINNRLAEARREYRTQESVDIIENFLSLEPNHRKAIADMIESYLIQEGKK